MKFILIFFMIINFLGSCFAQRNKTVLLKKDSQTYLQPTDSALSFYEKNIILPETALAGKTYHIYFSPLQDTPLLNKWFTNGILFSNRKEINNLLLAYDAFLDEFILNPRDIGAYRQININKTMIDSVKLFFPSASYKLVKIKFDNDSTMKDGFYEIAHFKTFDLLSKHVAERYTNNAIDSYIHQTHNYLKVGNSYYAINKKKQLLSLFPDEKKKIKRKLAAFPATYKKISRFHLINTLNYIDSL